MQTSLARGADARPEPRRAAGGRARERWHREARARDVERDERVARRAARAALSRFAFVEVRYRTKSWNELGSCIEDAAAALDAAGRPAHPRRVLDGRRRRDRRGRQTSGSSAVLGLAPWIPSQLDLGVIRRQALRRRARRLGPLAARGSGREPEPLAAPGSSARWLAARTAPTRSFRAASTASPCDRAAASSSRCPGQTPGSHPVSASLERFCAYDRPGG